MRVTWLLIAAGAVVFLHARPCVAQISASATIRAKVNAGRRPPPRGPRGATVAESQTATLAVDADGSRALLRTPMEEPILLDVHATNIARVTLLISDPAIGTAAIDCRDEELVLRWPDAPDWPIRLSISRSVRAALPHERRAVAHFTIVAEY